MKRLLALSVVSFCLSFIALAGAHTIALVPAGQPPLVTTADFVSATVSGADGKAVLGLRLTENGASRLRGYSASHAGETLAFVVDGRVLRKPVLRVPITGSSFQVEPLDRDEAVRIAEMINH